MKIEKPLRKGHAATPLHPETWISAEPSGHRCLESREEPAVRHGEPAIHHRYRSPRPRRSLPVIQSMLTRWRRLIRFGISTEQGCVRVGARPIKREGESTCG